MPLLDETPVLTIRAFGRSVQSVFMAANEELIAINVDTQVSMYTRASLAQSMVVRIEKVARPNKSRRRRPNVFSLERLPPYRVIAFFDARSPGRDTSRAIEVQFSAKCKVSAQRVLEQIVGAVLGDSPAALAPIPPRARRERSKSTFGRVLKLTLGAVALCVVWIGWVALTGPSGQNQVRAWNTDLMVSDGFLQPADMKVLAGAAAEAGFDFHKFDLGPPKGATPFYVLSSAQCEDCRLIDQALPRVDHRFSPVIIPAVSTESQESVLGAVHAYCSDHPAASWLVMSVSGQIPMYMPQCDQWEQKISAGQVMRSLTGLDGDGPFIVAPNGAVFAGSIEHIHPDERAQAITEWLVANEGTQRP